MNRHPIVNKNIIFKEQKLRQDWQKENALPPPIIKRGSIGAAYAAPGPAEAVRK